jgi:hypothetical protein
MVWGDRVFKSMVTKWVRMSALAVMSFLIEWHVSWKPQTGANKPNIYLWELYLGVTAAN